MIGEKDKLTDSLTDYLEAVYIFEKENGFSRIKEIANFLSVKLPSVNKAIKELKKRKLLTHQRYGTVKLTDNGKKVASNLLSTHNLLVSFFKALGFNEKKSLKYGCYFEHIIEEKDKKKMAKLLKLFEKKNLWK
ncbi:MAG: metal-dependent transcriptional regulator [Elusimicrobiota bacterium]